MTYKRVRNIVLIIAGISFLAYIVNICYNLSIRDAADPEITKYDLPKDYNELFKDSVKSYFTKKNTRTHKSRNDISAFSYRDKYKLEITKIGYSINIPVSKLIEEKYTSTTPLDGYITISKEEGFETSFQRFEKRNPTKIHLFLYGESTRTIIKNDSVASYYLKLKNCAVCYDQSDNKAIYIDANQGLEAYSNIPINIMFIKKHNSLYFILLAPTDPNAKLAPDLLGSLIADK